MTLQEFEVYGRGEALKYLVSEGYMSYPQKVRRLMNWQLNHFTLTHVPNVMQCI